MRLSNLFHAALICIPFTSFRLLHSYMSADHFLQLPFQIPLNPLFGQSPSCPPFSKGDAGGFIFSRSFRLYTPMNLFLPAPGLCNNRLCLFLLWCRYI